MIFIALSMFFCHIIDDFCLQQSFLANGKQREWWAKNAPDAAYKYDYLECLFIHSLSWAFMIMLPIAWKLNFDVGNKFAIVFLANTAVHGIVDHLKANLKAINLIQDQAIHFMQIAITIQLFKSSLGG